MTADVISFRPDAHLKQLIMSECHKRGISITEYMIQLVYGSFETQIVLDKTKECIEGIRSHLIDGEDPQELIEVMDALIEIID